MKLEWLGTQRREDVLGISRDDTAINDIWVLDKVTGIVYQGFMFEASGDMERDVGDFLAST